MIVIISNFTIFLVYLFKMNLLLWGVYTMCLLYF